MMWIQRFAGYYPPCIQTCADICLSSICNRFCGNCPVRCYYSREIVNPENCSTVVDCPSIDHTCELNVNGAKRSDVVVKGACCGTDKCNNKSPDEIDRQVDIQQQKISELSQNTNNVTSHMSDCFDTISNCKEYKPIVCGQYAIWSQEHCARFCNICGTSTKTRVILPTTVTVTYQCYSCSDIDRLEDCSNTTTCESGKECFQLETLSYDLRPVYRLGCLDESLCHRLGVNPVQSGFGRRDQGLSLKGGCCKTDLCNTKLINVLPSTTTVSTSATVTAQDLDLWVDAVKNSHNYWIWTEINQRIIMETTFYLNKIDGSCAAGHNSDIVTLIPHNCTTRLHPLCETTIT
ncbi:unnamed protein product [Mytilus coruscus]|uniref:ShKT domain-containing protein n=1 Tax=Mytilus coruscus TaxID=42192 RepID=A0A6J8B2A4_MYTCO|nr:unnamed protein product [Mytilus coruscus]